MRRIFMWFFILVTLAIHTGLAGLVYYSFPKYRLAEITGVETKRTGIARQTDQIEDIFFVYTRDPNTEKVRVYRNQDTGWGLPFYFKFNAANIQASASGFAADKQLVQIKYYGVRFEMFSQFPNIISIKRVDSLENEVATASRPIASYVFYFLLLITLFFSIQFIRGWFASEKN